MIHEVLVSEVALADLDRIYDSVSEASGPVTARRYVARLYDRCIRIGRVPEQGTRRDDLLPGLRVIGFERRVAILFRVLPTTVVVLRVLYGGRDIRASVKPEQDP